jgi:hypothetical protein
MRWLNEIAIKRPSMDATNEAVVLTVAERPLAIKIINIEELAV